MDSLANRPGADGDASPSQRGRRRAPVSHGTAALLSLAILSCHPDADSAPSKALPLTVLSVPAPPESTPPRGMSASAGGSRPTQPGDAPADSPPSATDGSTAAAASGLKAERDFDRAFPRHGQAFHVLAQVFAAPDVQAPVLGYYRRGARMRARRASRGKGCTGSWHALSTGGFVCPDRGFILSDAPPDFHPAPPPPQIHARLPYTYFKNVTKDAPQYWRQPTPEEEALAKAAIAEVSAEQARASAEADQADGTGAATSTPPSTAAPPASDPSSPSANPETEVAAGAEGETTGRDPRLPAFLRMSMDRGFYISRGSDLGPDAASGERFVRSVRGAHVEAATLLPGDRPSHHGHALGGSATLPLGLVFRGQPRAQRQRLDGEGYVDAGTLAHFDAVPLAGRGRRIGKRHHQLTRDGRWVPTRALRIARRHARPPLVPKHQRWLHVDLAEQVLVAYEGDTPVYATLVSTGKPGHETPTGLYRIQAKHLSTTMDGSAGAQETYSIEDVPWTMYFQGSFALHGAFWHTRFGRVRSHGCVNLAPADAKHLFEWSTPVLPAGWHGVLTQPKAHSTYVLID